MDKGIEIRTSPHLKRVVSVEKIMRTVVLALLPICAFAVYQFGLSALLLLATTTGVAIWTEWFFSRLSGKGNTVSDWSVVITGLLLGLTLPPGFPLWMAAVAAFVGVALGKALFGGLGYNVMNPALVGRAFVQAAFPVAITTWTPAFAPGRFAELIPSTLTLPFMQPIPVDTWVAGLQLDGWSGATPLAIQKFQHIEPPLTDAFTGMIAGSAGETSALLILICGLWLAWQRMLDWRIPVSVLAGAALTALPFWLADASHYPSPWFVLSSGGLMLAAWFMASDMVASPVTARGVVIYGLFIGSLTVIIRLFGGLVEGVMYAILIGNAVGPLISSWTQPRVYGTSSRKSQG
ncbi:RnfABCDGE type electron transport complex subunit D [Thiorhodococcus mannitoliphagus]|uniref:Ion-translocating oxidoreductase complex subunit D n=1 Tax=Thiorhodococcus mannitoliphagus TaxID=329406 RepID=A0A6P1DQX2_9GAMM|nr:RnfABCDGE type electron transport complex subunit D [Thiorhodococcus mannitoliphagus]NEX19553.1 RnfABCDGE type electron transport complex subunit D [Thiorhodococcus mannitoliphagus]